MEKTVYADVLFLMNFGCDLITVCLTSRFCRLAARPSRAAAGAAVGALLSVFIILFSHGIASYAAGVPAAALMCLISYGKTSVPELLRRTAIMWSSACLFYGAVSSFSSALSSVTGHGGRFASAVVCAAAVPAVLIVSRLRRDRSEKESAYVEFSFCGSTVKVLCLVDSGNLLREPVSGDPVVIVASAAAPHVPEEVVSYLLDGTGDPPPRIASRFRLIPSKTINGEELLRAVRTDEFYVNGRRRRVFITLRKAEKGSFGTYDGVIPPSIT